MQIDQAALTGESLPVKKFTGDVAFSGSTIKQGERHAVVYATGGAGCCCLPQIDLVGYGEGHVAHQAQGGALGVGRGVAWHVVECISCKCSLLFDSGF